VERRIFGLENEYGVTCTFRGQRRLSPDEVARYLFRRVVHWGRSSNVFLENGARLYLDVGSHPEYATPECDSLYDLVVHDKAGERILESLVESAEQRLREEGIRGTIYLFNSTVSGNGTHGDFGPAIDNTFGTLNITNSTITGNSGQNRAINNGIGGTATILNSTISNNSGGGILNNNNLSITGGAITGNTFGGGIVAGGNTLMNGVTIANNSNNSPNFFGGGGAFITGSSASHATTIINCLVANNSTNGNGGGIRNAGVKVTLINTTISGNTSNAGGGGLNIVDGGLGNTVAINVTITNNRAGFGGGVDRQAGPVKTVRRASLPFKGREGWGWGK
jgi:hypothetical protein